MVVNGRCKRGQDQATPYTVWANTQCAVDVEVKELRFQAHDTFLGESKAVVQELTWTGKKSMSQSTSCYSFKGDKVPVAMNETSSRELVVVNSRHEYSPWSSRGLVEFVRTRMLKHPRKCPRRSRDATEPILPHYSRIGPAARATHWNRPVAL